MDSAKATSFLDSLRASAPGAKAPGGGGPPTEDTLKALGKLDAIERRLQELAKKVEPPDEGEPPKAPTDLMLFLQTRMELLEQKLQMAQEEAMRSNILLREREEAQKQAQKEVEEMFHSIREQSRSAAWDGKLREQFSASQARIQELESQLQQLQRSHIPPTELSRLLNEEDGRARLEQMIADKATKAAEQADSAPSTTVPDSPALDSRTSAAMLGKIADLERRLHKTEEERDKEKARRIVWEKDILQTVSKEPEKWRQSGGAQLIVEATLEALVNTVKERDAAAADVDAKFRALDASQQPERDRAELERARRKLTELQEALGKQLSIVQAWLKGDS